MKLSIIIPAYNEENCLEETITRVFNLKIEKEVVIVDDGSKDQTAKILEKLKGTYDFKLLTHPNNTGKGSAIKSGLSLITGDLLLIQDADLEYNPIDIPNLISKMSEDVSMVCGIRSSKVWPERGIHYVIGAKFLTSIINILFWSNLSDAYTGYKLFNLKRVSLKDIKSSGFEFESEVMCKVLKNKGKILEVPINYKPRSKKEGKKITWLDALKGLVTIFRCRFY